MKNKTQKTTVSLELIRGETLIDGETWVVVRHPEGEDTEVYQLVDGIEMYRGKLSTMTGTLWQRLCLTIADAHCKTEKVVRARSLANNYHWIHQAARMSLDPNWLGALPLTPYQQNARKNEEEPFKTPWR